MVIHRLPAQSSSQWGGGGGGGGGVVKYCNRRNFRTRKNFALWRWRTFVRYKFSYLEGGVTYTGIHTRLSYATNFRTFSQKYEMYEIKSRTKISAITVMALFFSLAEMCHLRVSFTEEEE